GVVQSPSPVDVTVRRLMCRNPITNGSAAVVRRRALEDVAVEAGGPFDETYRQCEDVELWLRMRVLTAWGFRGIGKPLTYYRIDRGGLTSSQMDRQLAAWLRVTDKLRSYWPAGAEPLEPLIALATAYQCMWMARRALYLRDSRLARRMALRAMRG